MKRVAAQLALLCVLGLLAPASAHAAACCLSSTAFGVGRLSAWEQASLGLQFAGAPSPGAWNENEVFVPNAARTSQVEFRASLIGLLSLHERVQLSARLPWVLNVQQAGVAHDVGHGLGDGLLTARFEPVSIGEYEWLPGVALTLGLTAPMGRSMNQSKSLLASDVTGRGAWALGAGVTVEQTWAKWFVQGNFGLTVPLPMQSAFGPGSQRFGPAVDVLLAAGREVSRDVVVSALVRGTFETTLMVNEDPVPNASARDLGVALAAAFKLNAHLTLQAACDTGIFVSGLGDNRPARVTGTLGVRYGFF